MENQQEREQPNQVQRQQQHDGLEINDNADFNVNSAAIPAQGRLSSFCGGSTRERSQGPAAKATVNTISISQANAQPNDAGNGAVLTQVPSAKPFNIASKSSNNPIILDSQLRKPRSTECKQKLPGLDVALPYNGGAEKLLQHDMSNVNDQAVAAAGSNNDGSQLHMQQPAGQNAPDSSGITQASIVRTQQDTPYPKLPPGLAQMVHEKGWSNQKVWHWYYNGMPVEEAPGVANDPPVTPAPRKMLESEGIYDFYDWNHYYLRRRDENLDPRQCKTVQFSGMDVQVMLLTGNDAGEEGSKILLNHIASAKEEFPNLEHLSFAECVFGSPTEASHGIKELFRTRFAYACQLTCTSAFVWSLSFGATHPGSKGDQEPRAPDFKVSITHFRAKKAFDEESFKLRLRYREFGVERIKQRLCRDVVDDIGEIRHKFEDSDDFIRLMELRHVLACLSIQGTLERHIEDRKRNHQETALVQPEPCKGWTNAKGCYARLSLACMTVRRRMESRQLLLKMPRDFHLLNIDVSQSSEGDRRIFTEMMTFAETWFPRLFFTDDLRKKYGNPWTVMETETTEDNEPIAVTEGTHSVVPGDRQSAMHAPQPSSDDGGALTTSSNENGQENDGSKKRRTASEGQRERKRRAHEDLLTRLSRRRDQVGQRAILPKLAESQQPLVSHPRLDSAVGWPQYESQASKSMDQPENQNPPHNYISGNQFVAGAQSVGPPNNNPQPYPSYRPSGYVMGWQQPGNQTSHAVNQLESSQPYHSFQPYGSNPPPGPALRRHQRDGHAYNAAPSENLTAEDYGRLAENYGRLAEESEEIARNLLSQMVPSENSQSDSYPSLDPATL